MDLPFRIQTNLRVGDVVMWDGTHLQDFARFLKHNSCRGMPQVVGFALA
jgi:hypothetical protein